MDSFEFGGYFQLYHSLMLIMYKRAKRENRVLFFKKAWLDFHFGLDIFAPNTSPKEKIENPSAPVSGRPNGAVSIRTAGWGSYW